MRKVPVRCFLLHSELLPPHLSYTCLLQLCVQGDDAEIAKLTERMKALLGPFVLRRLKTEVAGQLTEKTHATGASRVRALVRVSVGDGLASCTRTMVHHDARVAARRVHQDDRRAASPV